MEQNKTKKNDGNSKQDQADILTGIIKNNQGLLIHGLAHSAATDSVILSLSDILRANPNFDLSNVSVVLLDTYLAVGDCDPECMYKRVELIKASNVNIQLLITDSGGVDSGGLPYTFKSFGENITSRGPNAAHQNLFVDDDIFTEVTDWFMNQ